MLTKIESIQWHCINIILGKRSGPVCSNTIKHVNRDDPIYFVRFELPLIPLIDWNLEILHKCHNYFDLYKLLLISKSILVALFWTPYFFLSALVAFFGLSCPLQSWKHQHTNEKCYQNNILCLVNKNYDFFCNLLINFISNYQI